jgi:hypothetical protein
MSVSSFRLLRRIALLAFVAAFALAACQSEPSSNPTTSPIGSVDRVRPDVRAYINSEFTSDYEKNAALQYAAALQGKIDAYDDAAQIKQLAEIGFKAMDCMYYVFPSTKQYPVYARAFAVQDELQARTFNTKERALKYVRSLKYLSGSVWRGRDDKEFPGTCNFDLTGFTPTVLP